MNSHLRWEWWCDRLDGWGWAQTIVELIPDHRAWVCRGQTGARAVAQPHVCPLLTHHHIITYLSKINRFYDIIMISIAGSNVLNSSKHWRLKFYFIKFYPAHEIIPLAVGARSFHSSEMNVWPTSDPSGNKSQHALDVTIISYGNDLHIRGLLGFIAELSYALSFSLNPYNIL